MRKHWKYLSYVLRHKWYVGVACIRLGVPIHRAILHDWTKFLPREWFPYVNYFYGNLPEYDPEDPGKWIRRGYMGPTSKDAHAAFEVAWLHHQHRNRHHWQYWILTNDTSTPKTYPLRMPDTYIREMVADWIGAGKALGKPDMEAWYLAHKDKIILEDLTRYITHQVIQEAKRKGLCPSSVPIRPVV